MGIGLSMIFIVIAYQEGYLDKFKFITDVTRAANQVIGIINGAYTLFKPTVQVELSVNDTKQSANIKYTKFGVPKILNVPYNRKISEKMRPWKVALIHKKGQMLFITQEPGYPYMCSAKQLGGERIVAKHDVTNESMDYKDDAIPGYLGYAEFSLHSPASSSITEIKSNTNRIGD